MEENNFPKPPRSACTFCPYHSNEEWRKIKQNWEEVVKLDKMIRNQEQHKEKNKSVAKVKDNLFLHRDCIPIDEVDLREEDDKTGQYSLLDECEGMCGI